MGMNLEFPQEYSALLIGLPGVGKSEYCIRLAKKYLEKGEKVVYVATEKRPSEIRERMKEIGADVEAHEGNDFLFIDVFTRSAGEKEEKVLYVDNPANLNMVSVRLTEATDALGKPVRIIFDSLSTFFLHAPEGEVRSFFESINTRIKMDNSFALFTLHEEMHDDKVVIALKAMVLSVLEMEIEDAPSRKRKFRVAFAKKGLTYSPDWFEFRIKKEGLEFSPIEKPAKPEEPKTEEKPAKPKKRSKKARIARIALLLVGAVIILSILSGGDKGPGGKPKLQDFSGDSEEKVYFFEDFNDGSADWNPGPDWEVVFPIDEKDGVLTTSSDGVVYTSFGSESWRDYEFSFKVLFRDPGFGMNVYVRRNPRGAYGVTIHEGWLGLWKDVGAKEKGVDLAAEDYFFASNQVYEISIEVQGEFINVFVNDEQIIGFTDVEDPFLSGAVGFETLSTKAYIDDVKVAAPPSETGTSESGVVLKNDEEILLIYTGDIEHTARFELTDVNSIEYVEVTVDARVTPEGYNDYADGVNALTVQLNGELPVEGGYGLPDNLDKLLKNVEETEGDKKHVQTWTELLRKSIWYAPSNWDGALGTSGVRRVKFDKKALIGGTNVLNLRSSDREAKENNGDGIFVYSYSVSVKREGTAPPATTPTPTTPAPAPQWYDGLTPNQIKGNTRIITYQTLVKQNENYLESIVNFKGEVFRIRGDYGEPYEVLIRTAQDIHGNYYGGEIYLSDYFLDPRLVEGDIVNVYGVPDGFFTYEEHGDSKSVPKLIPLLAYT